MHLWAALLLAASISASEMGPRRLASYARKHAVDLDWTVVVGTHTLVYLGEKHPNAAIKSELAARLPELKTAGITHLALEMLGDDAQGLLDRYATGEDVSQPLYDRLADPKSWGWAPDAYLSLIAAARAAGIKVLAIDVSPEEKEVLRGKQESCDGFDGHCGVGSPACAGRDCRMASHLENALRVAGTRVVVLIGSRHLPRQRDHMDDLYGRPVRVYKFVESGEKVHAALVTAGRGSTRSFLEFPRGKLDLDGVILVPEVVSESELGDPSGAKPAKSPKR